MKKILLILLLAVSPVIAGERHWMYFRSYGTIWVYGELREYVMSRGLMDGGRRAIVDGHTIWQVELTDGEWVNVWP
jgi:hypothetical protein